MNLLVNWFFTVCFLFLQLFILFSVILGKASDQSRKSPSIVMSNLSTSSVLRVVIYLGIWSNKKLCIKDQCDAKRPVPQRLSFSPPMLALYALETTVAYRS